MTVKFNAKTKSAIWQEARKKVGGFGMWIEVGTRYISPTSIPGNYYTNRLKKGDDDGDLDDFINWRSFCTYNFELINDHTLLDIYVHDREQLIDNLMVLLDKDGNLIKSWTINECCSPKGSIAFKEFISKYEEK